MPYYIKKGTFFRVFYRWQNDQNENAMNILSTIDWYVCEHEEIPNPNSSWFIFILPKVPEIDSIYCKKYAIQQIL